MSKKREDGWANDDNKWDIDLAYGNLKEAELVKLMSGDKLEVKADKRAHETGNVAVEFECYGKPSGISVSKASHYAFVCKHIQLIIETERLKELLTSKKFYQVFGGDNNASHMYLVPLRELIKYQASDTA